MYCTLTESAYPIADQNVGVGEKSVVDLAPPTDDFAGFCR